MRSWVEVSRSRIRENYRAVRAVLDQNVQIMAVVKADAYRHGALEISRLLEEEGARWLAVSNIAEGIALRKAGIGTRILVMADFLPDERGALEQFRLTPVVHSLDNIAAVRVPYHLKIDSGMGRLGTRAEPDEILRAVTAANAPLEGLMTHFASSANYESRQTEEQIGRFEAVLAAFRARGTDPPITCICPAPFPSRTGAPKRGAIWCAPATRFTDTFRPAVVPFLERRLKCGPR